MRVKITGWGVVPKIYVDREWYKDRINDVFEVTGDIGDYYNVFVMNNQGSFFIKKTDCEITEDEITELCNCNDKCQSKAPEMIYLQVCAGEITWCEDKIEDGDIKYMRIEEEQPTRDK